MSIETAHTVYRAWSAPGAPPADSWELVANIQAFLASGAGPSVNDLSGVSDQGGLSGLGAVVVAVPVAAQVKATDGPDWVVGCVLLAVTARVAAVARIAYGYCARLQWTGGERGRWVIAPGAPPARAPSTWPGTALAAPAGWRPWGSSPDQ